mgnify:CR=1 FL=1
MNERLRAVTELLESLARARGLLDDPVFMARFLSLKLDVAHLAAIYGHYAAIVSRGELIENAFTRRVRFIVLRNADDAPGRWFDETRDVAADFRRAFGSEAPTMAAA